MVGKSAPMAFNLQCMLRYNYSFMLKITDLLTNTNFQH